MVRSREFNSITRNSSFSVSKNITRYCKHGGQQWASTVGVNIGGHNIGRGSMGGQYWGHNIGRGSMGGNIGGVAWGAILGAQYWEG